MRISLGIGKRAQGILEIEQKSLPGLGEAAFGDIHRDGDRRDDLALSLRGRGPRAFRGRSAGHRRAGRVIGSARTVSP